MLQQDTEAPSGVVRVSGIHAFMWCPGCDDVHVVSLAPEVGWTWDGDILNPTFNPSILVTKPPTDYRCHSFVRAGHWEFLTDCSHSLAGQVVPMVPLPSWVS